MRAQAAAAAVLITIVSCSDDISPVGPTLDAPANAQALPTTNTVGPADGRGSPSVGSRSLSPSGQGTPTARKLIELPAIEAGGTIRLRSTCTTPATWQTSDATVATVVEGLVTGVAPGRARISETCGRVTSSVSIEVVRATTSYAFDPPPPKEITEGDTGHFRVNVIREGKRSRVTAGVVSSAPTVLRLNLEGDRWRYTGTRPGVAEIRVTQGDKRRLTHSVRVAGPDYEIANVRRYNSIIDVADWLRFTWRANTTARRFEVAVKFQQGSYFSTCTETFYNPTPGKQETELSIPDVCGTDDQWSTVTITPADGHTCKGCGTFRRTALPQSRNISREFADPDEFQSVVEESRKTNRRQTGAARRQ